MLFKKLNKHCLEPFLHAQEAMTLYGGVGGGTHGQILLRACTVYISDSKPNKSGSLPEFPELSRTNPTPDNFVFHTII